MRALGRFVFYRTQNRGLNPFGIGENVVVPKSNNTPTLTLKPLGSFYIAFVVGVLSAVGFDREAVLETGEIENVGTKRVLTAKFAGLQATCTQRRPQPALGVGHLKS